MMKFLLGVLVGAAAVALYQSEEARNQLQQRMTDALDAAPLPDTVKQPARDAAASLSSAVNRRQDPASDPDTTLGQSPEAST